jgi:hypothetical protein
LLVVKGVRIPFDEGKILAVMVGVAAHAALTGTGFQAVCGVQATMGREARGDLVVTV